ncbi:MAG: hypothetical protein H6712_03655 [Myxococcales bacterium]|nr:hypothetical protein [Myxococcales bacterium]MCB9712922.1 hypothetical protein [Myxococcales bacterium]
MGRLAPLGLGLLGIIASGCDDAASRRDPQASPTAVTSAEARPESPARARPEPESPARARPAPETRPSPLVPVSAWSDEWMLEQADRYLYDLAFRREMLERSLTNHDNQYSRARLSAYARDDQGWDLLPEWVPRTQPITAAVATRLAAGETPALDPSAAPLWDGTRPSTMAQWVELGRKVFFEYPLRPEVFAEHALAHPAIATEVGLGPGTDERWPGLVLFEDIGHEPRVGITCALCHTTVEAGAVVEGRARRELDYGRLRLAYHRDSGAPLPPVLAERMASWGPGRADITEDDDQDPVAIPDLWGVKQHSALTQAGTIRHLHPAVLAIRQETQITHANRERSRPPRELAWALAMYVYSLQPPPREAAPSGPQVERGAELFARGCERCHDDAVHGGDPVPARLVGTDPTLAFGLARGTGRYRPAPLLRVAEAAPYLHHGQLASLEELLSTERLAASYDRGVHGPGPIEGHLFGTELPPEDRGALLAYLRTL